MNVLKSQPQFRVNFRQGGGVNTAEIVKPDQIFESFSCVYLMKSQTQYQFITLKIGLDFVFCSYINDFILLMDP